MRTNAPGLKRDPRGVSEVIGFLLIFAILVILLSINQAQFVPQENSEVEFQHFQEVRDDMTEVRNAVSTAGQTDVPQYPTVALGTNYPTRLFAVNPPPPTGTLRTSRTYNVTIAESGGPDPREENVTTEFLEYRNGYNELDVGSIWYENSVLYLDERANGGNVAVIEDQSLLTGDTDPVRITALQRSYSRSSTGRVSIAFYPTETPDVDLSEFEGDVTVRIPTRLDSGYWDAELGEYDAYDGSAFETTGGEVNFLRLTVDVGSLRLNTVGIDANPDDRTSAKRGVGQGGSPGNGAGNGGAGDPIPDGAVAFLDGDGDGVYDAGEETYTVAELEDLSVGGSLRVINDAVVNDGSLDGIEIDAGSIVVEPGVEMRTTGGGQEIQLTSEGDIDLTSASVRAVAPITVDAGGQLVAEAASIEATGGGGDIELTSGGLVNLDDASVQSIAPISVDAGGRLSLNGADVAASGGGSDVTLESGADIAVSDASVRGVNVVFDSSGSIDMDGATLAAASYGGLSADLTGNADLFVEGAEFTAGGSPTDLVYGPGNSVNVIGEPAVGGTTS